MRKLAMYVLLLLLLPLSVGQAQSNLNQVVVGLGDDPPSGDPQKARGAYGGHLLANLFEGLVVLSPSMDEIRPALATSWEKIDDQAWRFELRQGVTFHNGEAFNAESVRYTLQRMQDPTAVRLSSSFTGIDSVEIIDEYTVVIHTKTPDPTLLLRLEGLMMMPPVYTASVSEEDFGRSPIGTGPYRLVEWVRGQRLVLEAYADHWNGKAEIDRLIFRPIPEGSTRVAELRTGNVDIITDLSYDEVDSIDQDPNLRVGAAEGRRTIFINMDLLPGMREELQDPRVRQAMNYAIDRQLIIDTLLSGYGRPLATLFRPDFFGFDPDLPPYPYDPERARQLLAEAGYPNGFSITMLTSPNVFNKALDVSEAVVAMLAEVGIQVELKSVALQSMRDAILGGQAARQGEPLYAWNWGSPVPDPDSPLTGLLTIGTLSSYIQDQELHDMITEARSTMDVETRRQQYVAIQRRLYDDPPMIFLYLQWDLYGVNERLDWAPRKDEYILGVDMSLR